MWIPKTENEIIDIIKPEQLHSNAHLSIQKELPKDNREVAKDIAAMANNGGTLIFGIEEKKNGNISQLNPIPLLGQIEHLKFINSSLIAESPIISITTIPTANDPNIGYIAIIISISERAPHMVLGIGENRFYGRSDVDTILLSEGEVGRLYTRRHFFENSLNISSEKLQLISLEDTKDPLFYHLQNWLTFDELLSLDIKKALLPPNKDFSYLFLVVRPVFPKYRIFESIISEGQTFSQALNTILGEVESASIFPHFFNLDLRPTNQWVQQADGLLGKLSYPDKLEDPRAPANTLILKIGFDSTIHLFCGRLAERFDNSPVFFSKNLAGLTTRFAAFAAKLYTAGDYKGLIDMGLAITGVKGAVPEESYHQFSYFQPYPEEEHKQMLRTFVIKLKDDPQGIAKGLSMPLINAITQNKFNPFKK